MSLQQCKTLQNRIENVIDLYRDDDLADGRISNSEVIGVLEMIKLNIFQDSLESDDDEEPDSSEEWKGERNE